jgi:hypothetical protein
MGYGVTTVTVPTEEVPTIPLGAAIYAKVTCTIPFL